MISAIRSKAWTVAFRRAGFSLILGVIALTGFAATLAYADEAPSDSAANSTDVQSQAPPSGVENQKESSGSSDQVLTTRSIFFPDIAYSAKPLTPGGKFKLSLVNSVSPGAFLGSAAGAGFAQAANSPAGYGQGAEGFGKRFGSSMATNASTNLLGTFLLASIAHHDPRYFVQGKGGLGESVKFGLQRVVVTRTDSGQKVFNWDGLLAPLLASALANTYQPDAERTVGRTFGRYGYSIATTAGINVLKEFWPTIARKVLVPIGITKIGTKP